MFRVTPCKSLAPRLLSELAVTTFVPLSHQYHEVDTYMNSSGVISFGINEIDPNPRVVVESLACNKPVFLGPDTVTASITEEHFPYIGQKVKHLNETHEIFMQWVNRDYGEAPRQFFDTYASEGTVYSHLIRIILEKDFRTSWHREYI